MTVFVYSLLTLISEQSRLDKELKKHWENEAGNHLPSHRDLLGHLGNLAIQEYQELPKINV